LIVLSPAHKLISL